MQRQGSDWRPQRAAARECRQGRGKSSSTLRPLSGIQERPPSPALHPPGEEVVAVSAGVSPMTATFLPLSGRVRMT